MNKNKVLKVTSIILGILFAFLVAVSFSHNDAMIVVFAVAFAIAFIAECVFGIKYMVDKKKRITPKRNQRNINFNVLITCKTTSLLKYDLIIDDKVVGKIKNKEHVCLNLPFGIHTICFKSLGEKSKKMSFEVNTIDLEINYKRIFKRSIIIRELTSETLEKVINQNYKRQAVIKKVRILGERRSGNSREYSLYSVLVIYKDGKKDRLELRGDSKLFKDLQRYMSDKEIENVSNYRPFTDEELDVYDLLDED